MTPPNFSGGPAASQPASQGYALRLRAALDALEQDRAQEARAAFIEITSLDAGRAAGWIGLALACSACGDPVAQHHAVDQALALEPGNLWGLVLKGDVLLHAGNAPAASAFYLNAIKLAPPDEHLPPPLRMAIQRARSVIAGQRGAIQDALQREFMHDPALPERFRQSVEILTGNRQIYHSSPRYFHYPGLPSIEFHDRAHFPWLAELEAQTAVIREELLRLLPSAGHFRPYIASSENAPSKTQDGLLDNTDWTACYLIKQGQVQQDVAQQCPHTMAVIAGLPLCDLPARAPSVLFSRLEPGAHIPPHCGLVNTRLIAHLPLVVPDGCEFRVGATTRTWREGEAWVFDDSIEHEAWNRSNQTRVILLFEVWRPELPESEREAIRRLFRTIDSLGGARQDWDI